MPTETADRKKLPIKFSLLGILLLLILGLAAYFEFTFRQIHQISGVIHGCFYQDANFACSYVQSDQGNFLLTPGSIDKMREEKDISAIYDRRVKLQGRISRQRLGVRDLAVMNRFQVERWQFEE